MDPLATGPPPPDTVKEHSAGQWAPQVEGTGSHAAFFDLLPGVPRAGTQGGALQGGGDKVLEPG